MKHHHPDSNKHTQIAPSMSSPLKNVFFPPETVQPQALQLLPQAKGPKKPAKPRPKQSFVKPNPAPTAIPTTTSMARFAATPLVERDTGDGGWENVSHCTLLEKGHQV